MMTSASAVMAVSYDHLQVALSVLIAVSASYAALDLGGRVTATSGWTRLVWLACGAMSMGSGIWAMHAVGMLALRLPVPVAYYWPTVLTALLIAMFASAAALYIVSRKNMGLVYALVSGSILGCGVAALHYTFMNAMRMAAECKFNSLLVALSVGFGIVFAVGGMWLQFYFRDELEHTAWRRIGSALLMGAAISAMHYTGMASASFFPANMSVDLTHAVTVSTLGMLGITAATLILLGAAMLSALVNRRFNAQGLQLALAEARVELARTTRLTMMGELTASIAHEIKQPLAAIVTNGEFCLRQFANARPNLDEVHEAIMEIVNDGNRASSVISRIRALLMKGAPDRVELDINELIREVVYFVRYEMNQNNIFLRLDLAADLPLVLGDRVQLQQVLVNIVMNGIEAMRTMNRHRELLMKSVKTSEGVLIQIQDSGPGIDPDAADRIFEPFFTTKSEGVGMGLSISRSIVESHGGRMWNTPISNGALFEFILLPTSEMSHG